MTMQGHAGNQTYMLYMVVISVVYATLEDIPQPVEMLLMTPVHANTEEGGDNAMVASDHMNTDVDVDNESTVPSTSSSTAAAAALPPKVNAVRNKRSIFDDDDVVMDETPSPTAIDKNNNSEEEGGGANSRDERFPRQQQIQQLPNHPTPSQMDRLQPHHHQQQPPPHPSSVPVVISAPGGATLGGGDNEAGLEEEEEPRIYYKFVDEGPGCPVKRRKDDLIRLNADYHLAALHQLYVPNVNGNWGTFPDLAILQHTQPDHIKALKASTRRALKQQQQKQKLSRKRKRSSSDDSSEEDEDDDDDDEGVYNSTSVNCSSGGSGGGGRDNSELIACWERMQEQDTDRVESVVPLVNPFFYFLKQSISATDDVAKAEQQQPENLLANMAGRLPRYVPLRTDFGMVVVPPEMPAPGEEVEGWKPPPTAIQFNRELAKELGIERVCEGVKGDVYEPVELSQFLEAMLRQRLPKFQQANLFYKRSWPGAEDRSNNLSLELLNSLYLNRVLEFRRMRRRRRRRRLVMVGSDATQQQHRKRRRKSGEDGEEDTDEQGMMSDGEEELVEEEEEEVEVADVHVFDGFLEMQTMAFRSSSNTTNSSEVEERKNGNTGGGLSSGIVAKSSARRLFYVNDERLFGHQPSILDEMSVESDPLPLLDDWDLFRVRWQSMEFLAPVLSATARTLYASWPRMRWNFLLDYFKAREQNAVMGSGGGGGEAVDIEDDDEEGGEVVRIHENNFRLPSFNRLTEENLLGIRQRRGRVRRIVGEEDEDGEDEEVRASGLAGKIKCQVESYRERDFVQVCMAQWPQLFEGVSFDYDKGQLTMRHEDVDTRWRFMGEFRELLKEVTRLGVAGEEDDEEEEEREEEEDVSHNPFKNGFATTLIKKEKAAAAVVEDSDGGGCGRGVAAALRPVDEPHVELFKEWHESVQVQSYNDELLTILPYVVID